MKTQQRFTRRSNAGPRNALRTAGMTALALATLAGCDNDYVEADYGHRGGVVGEASVNGTSVLGRLFEQRGCTVRSRRWLSPAVGENSDVIVWFPDDFAPPSDEVRAWLDDWLWEQDGRTLVYVGRDYDAAPDYWRAAIKLATPEQQKRFDSELTQAEHDYNLRRNAFFQPNTGAGAAGGAAPATSNPTGGEPLAEQMPEELTAESAEETEYVMERWSEVLGSMVPAQIPWYVAEPLDAPVDVRTLTGSDEWVEGIDATKLGIRLHSTLVPLDSKTLLAAEGVPLVMREEVGASQRIYVVNGSFLLNYSLVNHEHRRLAARLLDEIGPNQRVTFLESGPGGPDVLYEEPKPPISDPLNIFRVFPANFVLFQLAVLGGAFCLARWSVFGRPQRVARESHADFGEHVQALGELLAKRGDAADARRRLLHYKDPARHAAPQSSAAETGEANDPPARDAEAAT